MYKFRNLLTCGLLLFVSHVMGYDITVSPIEIKAGESTNLCINLSNTESFTAYQMSIYLPEGITVQKKTNGKYAYTSNAERLDPDFFNVTVQNAADGSILITVYAPEKDAIAGTNGELMRLPIDIASTVTTSLQGSIKNIEFTDVNSQGHKHSDIIFSLEYKEEIDIITNKCGDNLSWSYDDNSQTLTISGSGNMYDYDFFTDPWSDYKEQIQNINFPEGLTHIGTCAFVACTNITSITIPDSVTNISESAFSDCYNLQTINFGNGVTSICYGAFENCHNLISVTLSNSIRTIGNAAFRNCYNLSSVELGDRVEYIGDGTFHNCHGLGSINIPSSVTKIEKWAFAGCIGLRSVMVEEDNVIYDSRNNSNAIIETETNTLITGCTNTIIPNTVTCIQSGAFSDQAYMTSITIPNSITNIENTAFCACNSLTDVYCLAENVPNTDSNAFEATPLNSVTLHVPTNSIEAYRTTEPWSNFGTIVAIEGAKVEQTIGISALPEMTEGDAAYALPQQTDQGLTLTWTAADETIARISGYQLSPLKAGITTITATQEGNNEYQSFTKTFSLTVNEKEEVPSIEDTDISQMDNVIYIEPTEVKSDSETTLSFMMKNTANIRGFQFDLFLPEGITVVKSSKGKILGELNPERLPEEDEHQLTFSEQTNGAIRFLCSSLYDETFTGTSGVILTLQIKIDENMEDGEYPVQLKNMILNETDISKFYQTEFLQSKITVTSYMLGDINDDGEINVLDYTGVANHIHGNTPEGFVTKAADVDSNSVIDVRDYTGVANIIHTGFVSGSMGTSLNAKEYNNVEPQ